MKKAVLSVAVLSALSAPALALAEDSPFSANVSLTSDYLYRGISQTGAQPAVQGGFDYAHPSGFYAGVWGSNISWLSDAGVAANASVELDTYLGFSGEVASGLGFDVGFLRYNYPGAYAAGATKADTDELYASVSYGIASLKYSHSLGDTFGAAGASGSNYIDLSVSYEVEAMGLTLDAHYGKQTYKGPNAGSGDSALGYSDYNVGVSKSLGDYTVSALYSNTNTPTGAGTAYHVLGKDLGKGTVVVSLSRSL